MKKILVLMSTYNGHKYLSEQIDSILKQEKVDVSLRVRDDGSTDKTISIIEEYVRKYPSKVEIQRGDNLGAKKSFLTLITEASDGYDYYALSDQDDIWKTEKLIKGIERLRMERNSNIPLIYGSPVTLYAKGVEEGMAFYEHRNQYTFGNFLIKNYYPGCTMVFNKALKNLVAKVAVNSLNDKPLHDHWLNLICTGCGGSVVIDDKSYILYRQHENNVIGAKRNIITKLKDNGLLSNDHTRYKYAAEVDKVYGDFLTKESKEQIDEIKNYNRSIQSQMKLLFDRRIKPVNVAERLLIMMNVILKKY